MFRNGLRSRVIFRLLLLLCLIAAPSAFARPQYSALFGQSCFLCHVNPTGNGMRELYGSTFFGPQYLPVKPTSFELLDKIKPRVSESITIGADLRTIWLSTNTVQMDTLFTPNAQDTTVMDTSYFFPETGLSAPFSNNTGSAAQMEGNLYLEIRPSEHFMIYLSRGVSDEANQMEIYGLANLKGFKAWIKGGQFQENYGYRFADHTSFVRTGLWTGFDGGAFSAPTPLHYGVGLEAGTRIGGFDLSVSRTSAQSNYPLDRDQQKRWVGRLYAQKRLPILTKFTVSGGASGMHASEIARDPEIGFPGPASRESAWGGFGSLAFEGFYASQSDPSTEPASSLLDRVVRNMGVAGGESNFGWLATSFLFEYDRKQWSPLYPPDFMPTETMSAYCTAQFETMVYQGIWLTAAYDWLDNDEVFNALGESERTSLGVTTFLLPWVELSARHRLYSSEVPLQSVERQPRNKRQIECQLHLFF